MAKKQTARKRRLTKTRRTKTRKTKTPRTKARAAARALPETPVMRAAAEELQLPEAEIRPADGPVTVEIMFGHAQHGKYTLELFDPTGRTSLWSEGGVNTDSTPDRYTLDPTPAALLQHIVVWLGVVNAFTAAPGQQYSIVFEISQNGVIVPGGRTVKKGALNGTQAFYGAVRLVTS